MISLVDVIEEKCRKYPHLRYDKDGDSIIVLPQTPSGFPVGYSLHGNSHFISFLGWHEEFEDRPAALNCFAFGLSKDCRLQVWKRGKFEYKWIVEAQAKDGAWYEDSCVGLFFFPFWLKKDIVILQNELIEKL